MIHQSTNRRLFLKTAGAATVGAALGTAAQAAPQRPPAQSAIPRWRGFNLVDFFQAFGRGERSAGMVSENDLRWNRTRKNACTPFLFLVMVSLALVSSGQARDHSSATFERKVVDAGGRVDFIFGDDRDFKQCHASTVVECADETLLCAWFGGTEEKNPDVSVWMSML